MPPQPYLPPRIAKRTDNLPPSFVYQGRSMFPTLRLFDELSPSSYGSRSIRAGDIIVFRPPGSKTSITHRVISTAGGGIQTRGDNLDAPDPYFLLPENIIGRVAFVKRGGKIVPVPDGAKGLFYARLLWTIRKIVMPPYGIVTRHFKRPVLQKVTALLPEIKTVSFSRPEGMELQLMMGKRVIGRRPLQDNQWHILFPFMLVIDETTLPIPSAPSSGSPSDAGPPPGAGFGD